MAGGGDGVGKDIGERVPALRGWLRERRVLRPGNVMQAASGCDETVEAIRLGGLFNGRMNGAGIGRVQDESPGDGCADIRGDALQLVAVDIREDDAPAVAREHARRGAADRAGTAGDERRRHDALSNLPSAGIPADYWYARCRIPRCRGGG